MATIEERVGTRKTSHRVIWYVEGQRKTKSWPTREKAELWASLIEETGGDAAAAARALAAQGSVTAKLSEVADKHISRLIDATEYTKAKYRETVRTKLHPLDRPIDTITEDDIARWVEWMHTRAFTKKIDGKPVSTGYSAKTISNAHGLLFAVMDYAVKRGLRSSNPCTETRLPKNDPGDEDDKFLTVEEMKALSAHVHEHYLPLFWFFFSTGVRTSEALALRAEDFTVSSGTAMVRITKAWKRNAEGAGYHIGEPKSRRSRRTIDVDDATMSLVWPLVRAAGHGGYVFKGVQGSELNGNRARQNFWYPAVRRARAAGFTKKPGMHALRHSHAAHMLSLGMPIHELSWRLGHSSIQVTIDRYGHLVPSRMGAASKLFGDSMQGIQAPAPPAQLAQ